MIPGGFGDRGVQGKALAANWAQTTLWFSRVDPPVTVEWPRAEQRVQRKQ